MKYFRKVCSLIMVFIMTSSVLAVGCYSEQYGEQLDESYGAPMLDKDVEDTTEDDDVPGGGDKDETELPGDDNTVEDSSEAEDKTTVQLRENALVTVTPEKYASSEYKHIDGVYEHKYEEWDIIGSRTSMQVDLFYNDMSAVNCDSVYLFPHKEDIKEEFVESWTENDDVYNFDMMLALNRASNAYAEAHPEQVQTRKNGDLMQHFVGNTYFMVPTYDFIDYLWKEVEWALINIRPTIVAFEEPEIWNYSGYSQSFKDEWKAYFNEDWQDPESSPEAMMKSMELKTHLISRVIIEMSKRIKEVSPNTKIYLATHSTVNYTAWDLTAGLNDYVGTGELDGVIGQVWSDTIREKYKYQGRQTTDEYLNAYLEFASYTDSLEGYDFFALADPMADNESYSEEENQFAYRQTIAASLMNPYIHRFEILPWVSRAFRSVSDDYKTILMQCFNALNYVGGQAITMYTGTPGISYAVSDSLSWLKNTDWAVAPAEGYYGIAAPIVSAGIPLGIQSLDMLSSADDLSDTEVLIVGYDNQIPQNEAINDAIAEWVKDGGTLLLTSGCSEFWNSSVRFWAEDGSPVENLIKKLSLDDITVNKGLSGAASQYIEDVSDDFTKTAGNCSIQQNMQKFSLSFSGSDNPILKYGDNIIGFKETVGNGNVIVVGLPSTFYADSAAASTLLLDLVKYAVGFTSLEYTETNMMITERGNLTVAHALRTTDKLSGKYINIFDERLEIVTDPMINAKDSVILWNIENYDLSVPRLAFSGGKLTEDADGGYELTETTDKTIFRYTAANAATVASRLLAPDGRYPKSVMAESNSKELQPITVWDNATDSLLILTNGSVDGVLVTVEWSDEYVKDGQNIYFYSDSIKTYTGADDEYLISNTAYEGDGFRFCDLAGQLVYKFDISEFRNPVFALNVSQNYIIDVSADGNEWITVVDYSEGGTVEHIRDNSNGTIIEISPYDYDISDNLYIRIRNTDITMGWGAIITKIEWSYSVTPEEAEALGIIASDDGKVVEDSAYIVKTENGISYYSRTVKTNAADADTAYLHENKGANNADFRFNDFFHEYVTYYFNLRDTNNFVIDMDVSMNYVVEVSKDNTDWTEAAKYVHTGDGNYITDSSNKTTVTMKAEDYGFTKDMYVRIRNTGIVEGWGGAVHSFKLTYTRAASDVVNTGGETAADDSAYIVKTENGVSYYSRTVKTNASNEDTDYLYEDHASSNNEVRFCDWDHYLIYRFDLNGMSNFKIDIDVIQNYLIEVSSDNSNWTVAADYSEGGTKPVIQDGSNRTTITIAASDYGITDNLYIRLRNTGLSDGWGGAIYKFIISYQRP